ncbi:hypothetical protein F8388_001345 [Cannabis sativa]|uniref:DUF1985 domain-containing protein n=1 Tax=Cannabis sativa TaxID=3483 RepID=A0A7J6DY20_CANSA|nr:hypothetical protein F8388_001345 [Cannabis sativa]
MDKTPDTINIIPYVDPGVQQQDYHQSDSVSQKLNDQVEPANVAFVGADSGTGSEVPVDASKKPEVKVDSSDDDFVEHIESGTSSKVPVEKKIQPTVRETRSRKKKAAVADSDVPNPPVRRTTRAGVKCVASKGPSPSILEESVKKYTSLSNVDVYLKMKPEHRFASKLQIWNNLWVIKELNGNLTPSQKALFFMMPFLQFLKMSNIKWNIVLPHLALVREVHQEKEDLEKWFLIRDRVVRFGLEEFVLITGLSPEGSSDLNEFKQKMLFKKKMFPDLTIKVIQEQVRARFLSEEFDDDVDTVKMAIVFLLSHYCMGMRMWDRTFHYMNLAFKDSDNIYYKIEKVKEEKDKVLTRKKTGSYSELVFEGFNNPEDFYHVDRELKKSALQSRKFELVYLPKKPRGFDGKFSNLEKALVCIQEDQKKILLSIKNLKDEFSIKFDEVIELLKSKKGSFVPKDFEEKVDDSCSENLDVGGNDDEFPDPPSPEVVSNSKLPEYDDDEGGLQLSLVREDKVPAGLGEGRDEGRLFSYETIKVDQSILDLVDSLTRACASPISAKNDQWDLVSIPESAKNDQSIFLFLTGDLNTREPVTPQTNPSLLRRTRAITGPNGLRRSLFSIDLWSYVRRFEMVVDDDLLFVVHKSVKYDLRSTVPIEME